MTTAELGEVGTDYVQALADYLTGLDDAVIDEAFAHLAARLNPPAVEMLETMVGATGRGWRANPLRFAVRLGLRVPETIVEFRHMQVLSDQFRKAVRLESRFQTWNLPSQMQKTTSLKIGCLWALDQDPTLPIIYTGAANDLCRRAALDVRRWAREYDDVRFQLMPDDQRADAWRTEHGGGMLGHGLHGQLAGFPARGVVVDDPLSGFEASHSKRERDAAMNEIVAVARLRLAEGGWMILAHARWHVDDPTGRLHKIAAEDLGVDVEAVVLPMIQPNEPDVWLHREPGEVLEPRRYSLVEANSRAAFLGSYKAAAMEQQAPLPEEGGEILREWWKRYTNAVATADRWITSWDMKMKDKASGDYVVGQAWAKVGGDYWIVDQLRGQYTFRQTKVAIALMQVRHPQIRRHVIENTGNGPEVMTDLRKSDPSFVLDDETANVLGVTEVERSAVEAIMHEGMSGLIPETPKNGKIVRVRVHLLPVLEGGNVHVPETAWGNALIDEASAFPPRGGGHDDMVDAASQAIKYLRRPPGKILGGGGSQEVRTPAPSARSTTPETRRRARILG